MPGLDVKQWPILSLPPHPQTAFLPVTYTKHFFRAKDTRGLNQLYPRGSHYLAWRFYHNVETVICTNATKIQRRVTGTQQKNRIVSSGEFQPEKNRRKPEPHRSCDWWGEHKEDWAMDKVEWGLIFKPAVETDDWNIIFWASNTLTSPLTLHTHTHTHTHIPVDITARPWVSMSPDSEMGKSNGRRDPYNHLSIWQSVTVPFSSVAQSCPTLCDPMDCSMPGLPAITNSPKFTQTHVHWVRDAIQPSHPLSSPSPPTLSLSQH